MRSLYDLAERSVELAEDGTYYPDICTIPIQKFKYTESPKEYSLTEKDVERPDIFIYKEYGVAELDDILFWINSIENLYDIEENTEILIPSKEDVEDFYYKYRV